MKRLMVIHSCYECKHLKVKDDIATHHYICTERNLRSLDIHAHTIFHEVASWFRHCTVWDNEEESCATCKHWDSSSFTEHDPIVRECLRIQQYQDCYKSDEDNYEPFRLKDDERETLAFTFDHDMYASGIYTRAEFLCNMYEPKESK